MTTSINKLSTRIKTYRLLMKSCLPDPTGCKLVDLGSGHGMFGQVSRRAGYDVTAVDVRKPWTLRSSAGMQPVPGGSMFEGIRWVEADVTTFDVSKFDVVLAIGLVYHLPLEAQLDLFRRSAGKPTVIDTEVFDPAIQGEASAGMLTPVQMREYGGAIFNETSNVWSSSGNANSFWFTHDSLLDAFCRTGRKEVAVGTPGYMSRYGKRRWYVLDPAR